MLRNWKCLPLWRLLTLNRLQNHFNNQWNLSNTGQNGGTTGIDIKYCNARPITEGSGDIIVTVIIQGVQLNHPDLNIHSVSYDTHAGFTIESTATKTSNHSYVTTSGRTNGTWNNEMGYRALNAFAAVSAAGSSNSIF